jgi:hypothetical protein
VKLLRPTSGRHWTILLLLIFTSFAVCGTLLARGRSAVNDDQMRLSRAGVHVTALVVERAADRPRAACRRFVVRFIEGEWVGRNAEVLAERCPPLGQLVVVSQDRADPSRVVLVGAEVTGGFAWGWTVAFSVFLTAVFGSLIWAQGLKHRVAEMNRRTNEDYRAGPGAGADRRRDTQSISSRTHNLYKRGVRPRGPARRFRKDAGPAALAFVGAPVVLGYAAFHRVSTPEWVLFGAAAAAFVLLGVALARVRYYVVTGDVLISTGIRPTAWQIDWRDVEHIDLDLSGKRPAIAIRARGRRHRIYVTSCYHSPDLAAALLDWVPTDRIEGAALRSLEAWAR